MTIRTLLQELAEVRRKLFSYGIRHESDYAVLLVAQALHGAPHNSGVAPGSDLIAPEYGRVEVRSRTLPLDGRNETRLNLPKSKKGMFEWFAGVVFNSDLTVRTAFLLPHDAAWKRASANKRNYVTPEHAKRCEGYKLIPRLAEAEREPNA